MVDYNINQGFKDLTRKVSDEQDVTKATALLVTGLGGILESLKAGGLYPPEAIDEFADQLRNHAPMWGHAVSTTGPTMRQGQESGR